MTKRVAWFAKYQFEPGTRASTSIRVTDALEEDEDPLSAYDDFIKWTSRAFPEGDHGLGLLQLLEEATWKFKYSRGTRGIAVI